MDAHVVKKAAELAEPARNILKKFGIDVNDPRFNGAALPTKYHEGLHSKEYYDWVNSRLRDAQTKEQAESILDGIRKQLEQGERPWECK